MQSKLKPTTKQKSSKRKTTTRTAVTLWVCPPNSNTIFLDKFCYTSLLCFPSGSLTYVIGHGQRWNLLTYPFLLSFFLFFCILYPTLFKVSASLIKPTNNTINKFPLKVMGVAGMIFLEVLGLPMCFGVGFAFVLGLLAGWAWKPTWVLALGNSNNLELNPSSVSSASIQSLGLSDVGNPNSGLGDTGLKHEEPPALEASGSMSKLREKDSVFVTDEDLGHLYRLVEKSDGGPEWKHVMERSTRDMSYQAWQRDPETGPPQYCSRTVYEDATPELMRDFFWDDEFRLKWDDMLVHAQVLEECPVTGTMAVHWIRKFPFFCSNREYIIGRRIWESCGSYYTVTKGVPYLSVPRKDKPRRVDLYYSSWYIRSVESRKGDGQFSGCEVILFHHEDMGIPWEIAKFGVRQGMWGAVRNIDRGFRAYQKHRASGACLSHHALMARINTKANLDNLMITRSEGDEDSSETKSPTSPVEKPNDMGIPKLLIIGGAVVIACTLNKGLLTKTLIFGIANRLGNIGRGAIPGPS